MEFDRNRIFHLIGMVSARTQHYLQTHHAIGCVDTTPVSGNSDTLALKDTTAIIGLDGAVGVLVAISFEHTLLTHLLQLETAGLTIPDSEQDIYLRETAAEIANVIVGNSMADLEQEATDGTIYPRVVMSPPTVIQAVGRLLEPANAAFVGVTLRSGFGQLSINIVGPRAYFGEAPHRMNIEGGKAMRALRVMVVDDSLLSQKKLIAAVEQLGHVVVTVANTGAKALAAYGEYLPDVVTMDITMPDMDGIVATRWILSRYPAAKILMITSHAEKAMVLDALDAGATGYVIKPFQTDKLREAIDRVANRTDSDS